MFDFFRRVRDANRIERAFEVAAVGRVADALSILDELKTEWAKDHLDAILLRGALLSLVGRHREAMTALIVAAQRIKKSPRANKDEIEYLTAYVHQYWQPSADKLDVTKVTSEERDALHIDGPIVLSKVRPRLRRRFPLHTKFTGIQIVD